MDKILKESSSQFEQKDDEGSVPRQEKDAVNLEGTEQTEGDTQEAQKTTDFAKSESEREYQVRFSDTSAIEEYDVTAGRDVSAAGSPLFQNILQASKLSPIQNVEDNTTNESGEFPQVCPSTSSSINLQISVHGSSISSLENKDQSIDQVSNLGTSSSNTENPSTGSTSQPIEIPSTSRDTVGIEPERTSPKRPTNFEPFVKQSIHVFYPRDQNSVLKMVPIPYFKGRVYLRDSPESSDYGGSPDSLEDPYLMEALCLSEIGETDTCDTPDNSDLKLGSHSHVNPEEGNRPSTSDPIEGHLELSRVSGEIEGHGVLSSVSELIEENFGNIPSESVVTEGNFADLSSASGLIEDNRADLPTELGLPTVAGVTEENIGDLPSGINITYENLSDLLPGSDIIE